MASERVSGETWPALAAILECGVPFTEAPRVEGAATLAEFAARSGLRPSQVLKTLLLDIGGVRHALLLIAGDRAADFAALRRHFRARSVRLADRQVVEAITGYRIGTVTPLAVRTPGLPVLLDEAVLLEEIVSLGTGRPGCHIRLTAADLARALSAIAGPFARPLPTA